MAGNINEAGIFTPASNLPLLADVQYLEPYGSAAFNRKTAGILNPGVYSGFDVTPGTGVSVVISSKAVSSGIGAACIDAAPGYQITVHQYSDVTLTIPKGKSYIVALEANYGQGVLTKQVSSNATLDAARFVVVDANSAMPANQIEICRVNTTSSTTQITQAMIDVTRRVNRRVGPNISDRIDSNDQFTVASSNAVRLAIAAAKVESDKKITTGTKGLMASSLTLQPNFDFQTYVFSGGEYLYIDWATAKNKPGIDYPNGYYQISILGLSDESSQTLLIRPVNYLQPLAPFMISWTGAAGSRVFRTRAIITALGDINQLTDVTPNSLTLQCHVGEFAQSSSAMATADRGYPIQEAGNLKVTPSAYGVQQSYTTYSTARTFNRGRTNAGAWGAWIESLTRVNLTANSSDFSAGKVMQVGDFGQGNSIPLTSLTTDFNSYINTADYNICAVPTAMKNLPVGFSGYGTLSVIGRGAGATTYVTQTLTCKNSKKQWRRTRDDTGLVWSEWGNVYTSFDKPTAEDVGALSLTNGGTITGQIKIKRGNGSAPIRMYQDNGADEYGVFLMKPTSDTFAIFPTSKGGAETGNAAPGIRPFTIHLDTGRVAMGSGLDVAGWSSVTGGLVSYGVSNPLKLASGTGENDYAAIFRVSEDTLYVIPTTKGTALTGDISLLRPLSLSLASGLVAMKHGLTVTGPTTLTSGLSIASGSGIAPGLGENSINIGDSDTGFRWNSDGNFDVMANAVAVMNIKPGVINPKVEIQLETGSGSWVSGRSQMGVISNRVTATDSSFQAMMRQNHSDRKFVIGGLGKTSFGIYMYLNSRKDADNAYDGGAWLAADGSWNCWGLSSTKEINAAGKISTSNIIQSTSVSNGAISWGNAGAGTSNNGDVAGTVWSAAALGGDGKSVTWLSSALTRAYQRGSTGITAAAAAQATANAAAPKTTVYTKTEADARYFNTASKAQNGWFKDVHTGVIIQWGYTTTTGLQWINFPVPFPTLAASIMVTSLTNGATGTMETSVVNREHGRMRIMGNQPFPLSWIAIGY